MSHNTLPRESPSGAPVHDVEPVTGMGTRARLLAVLLGTTALTSAGNLLLRPVPAEQWMLYAALAPVRGSAWVFGLLAGLSTGVAFASLGLAGCLLVRDRGRHFATAGAVLTGVGGIAYSSGFFASAAINWYATSSALDPAAGAALLEHVEANSLHAFGPQIVGFLSSVLGFLLISAALWRSRAVPRWLPILMPTTVVLTILAGTGLAFDVVYAFFMGTFVLVAWFVWTRATPRPPA